MAPCYFQLRVAALRNLEIFISILFLHIHQHHWIGIKWKSRQLLSLLEPRNASVWVGLLKREGSVSCGQPTGYRHIA